MKYKYLCWNCKHYNEYCLALSERTWCDKDNKVDLEKKECKDFEEIE